MRTEQIRARFGSPSVKRLPRPQEAGIPRSYTHGKWAAPGGTTAAQPLSHRVVGETARSTPIADTHGYSDATRYGQGRDPWDKRSG